MKVLMEKKYLPELSKVGLDATPFNIYGMHQQGVKGFKEIINPSIKIKSIRADKMRDNLPSSIDTRGLSNEEIRQVWVEYWRNKTA